MPLKVWDGASWTMAGQMNVWDGSAWTALKAGKVWNGSSWVQFHPGVKLEEYGTGIDLSYSTLSTDAQVGITLKSNGTAEYWYADLSTPQTNFIGGSYSWLSTGANTDYYAFMDTPSSGSFQSSSSATNTALQLNLSRTWLVYQASTGSNSVQSTLRIRTASGEDIVSQPVTLTVEVF